VDDVDPKRAYVSPLRTNAAARTRETILACATALFAGRGYGLVTVADIAAAAGVSPKTVFASVGSKREILDLIVNAGVAESGYEEAMRRILSLSEPAELLRALAHGTRVGNESQFTVHEVIHKALPVHEESDDLLKRATADYRAALADAAARLHSLDPRPSIPYTEAQTSDLLWYWFGPASWRALVAESGWSWDEAEALLHRTSVATLLRAGAGAGAEAAPQ
jgi:AcrR family transcriptional regulator